MTGPGNIIPQLLPGELLFVCGKRGSGKSTYLNYAIRLQQGFASKALFDPLDEHGILLEHGWTRPALIPGLSRSRKLLLRPDSGAPVLDRFPAALALCRKLPRPLIFGIDEVDKLCSPRMISASLQDCIEYGRHYGQGIICATRRPSQVHRSITANADYIAVFATTEPGDRDALESYGIEPENIPLDKDNHICYLKSYK